MQTEAEKLQKKLTNRALLTEIDFADSLVNEKKYEDAITIYKGLLGKIDKSYQYNICEIYRKLGNSYWYLKDSTNARIYYEKTLDFCTTNKSIYEMLASLYARLDCKKTLKYYLKSIELGADISYFTSATWLMMKDCTYTQEKLKENFEFYVNKFRPKYLEKMPAFNHAKPNANKKINIAYVSTDFYCHAMMSFILPILENHNTKKYNFTLYSLDNKPDAVTDRIKKTGIKFIDLSNNTVQEIAQRIYNDKIDIVIDLAGYVNSKAFWLYYKPAPIQMQYLGFLNTYGMKEVDYIITDEYSIPPKIAKYYTEKPMYLEHGMQKYCFSHPNTNVPECNIEPPCVKNGYITFGSFNTVSKIDDYTISLWLRLLNEVPNSRLLFYRTQMHEEEIARLTYLLEKHHADMSRVTFENTPRKDTHFKIYEQADIALDPVPFSGLTITIETILMGVPVLCMNHETLQAKGTARVNKALGLDELVCNNEDEYIQKGKAIATIEQVKKYRESLRYLLATSTIFNNYKQIAEDFEECFDRAFADYCKNQV